MTYPNISLLTPVYNRNRFLSLMVFNIQMFDYDKNKLEWVIFDDGKKEKLLDHKTLEEVQKAIHPVKIKYHYNVNKHYSIGEKRNWLIKNCTHQHWANMDSDDIYMPSYLKYSIDMMKENKAGIVSSPEMLFIFPHHNYQMSYIKCPAKRQCHEGCMVSTKKYVRSMGGFKKKGTGEGSSLIDFSENRCTKTDIRKLMVCVAHDDNTCDKDRFKKDKIDGKINPIYVRILNDALGISQSDPPSNEEA